MVIDEKGTEIWCRFEYELLPTFCFTCGILGLAEKECKIKLKKGEKPQYGKWLVTYMEKKHGVEDDRNRRGESRCGGIINRNFGFGRPKGRFGSDGFSWRKDTVGWGGRIGTFFSFRKGVKPRPLHQLMHTAILFKHLSLQAKKIPDN
jgi:hypothetical protein